MTRIVVRQCPPPKVVVQPTQRTLTPLPTPLCNRATRLIERGPQGPAGPQGPRGPAGPPGSGPGSYYEHTQPTPATVWTIQHDLGYYPDITVTSTGGLTLEVDVVHLSTDLAQVRMNVAMAGTARAE